MERYNKKRYLRLRKNETNDYSLSVRAQLSENINSTLPFKVMCFSIAFFASLCTSMLHVDEWTESQTIRNWVYIAFNFSCWSYGTLVPFFMLAYNPLWQKELMRLGRKFCCCFCPANRMGADSSRKKKTTKVKDTFGNNCYVDDNEHTTIYFSQLNAEWNAPEADAQKKKKKKPEGVSSTTAQSQPVISPRSISNGSMSPRLEAPLAIYFFRIKMCSRTVTSKVQKMTVPAVSRPVFKKAPKFPPGIKICEVLKLTAELSSMTIPQTTSIPQYPPGIRIPDHLKNKH
ncbi:hypothetical protein CAEBREN_08712 [Caenorhabditis brenneri]|uniref:Uncharacterized protein n=1 Tax=Caenorhabditis brenneri TaxID=135651 RepID=G0PIS0_CAEBE|nr:hypothetical protein CAEBREN_08712 [Caenorhabditis brenneri]